MEYVLYKVVIECKEHILNTTQNVLHLQKTNENIVSQPNLISIY